MCKRVTVSTPIGVDELLSLALAWYMRQHSKDQSTFLDEVLEKHLITNYPNKGFDIWYLGQRMIEELNQLLNPGIPFLTLPDVLHPEHKSQRRLSTWGAYEISERLGLGPLSSLGRNLDYAINEVLNGVSPDKAFDHLVGSLLLIDELVKVIGCLRFLTYILIPIREQVEKKYFGRR